MPRRRLAVALLVPQPWATEIDGLRRACGDAQLARVAPHITLVSPVNIREDDLTSVLALVRSAATAVPSGLEVGLGPAVTFLPDSPVLYLAVRGTSVDDGSLGRVRDRLRTEPLARPARWPFVPHVTVAQDQPDERLSAGVVALADYSIEVGFDRLVLLEERVGPEGGRRWVPIADACFGPRVVVARGSLPLELTTGSVIDPEAAALMARERCGPASGDAGDGTEGHHRADTHDGTDAGDGTVGRHRADAHGGTEGRHRADAHGGPDADVGPGTDAETGADEPAAGAHPALGRIVVTARRADSGELVGVAVGPHHGGTPTVLVVDPAAAGEGIEDHLTARWAWSSAGS